MANLALVAFITPLKVSAIKTFPVPEVIQTFDEDATCDERRRNLLNLLMESGLTFENAVELVNRSLCDCVDEEEEELDPGN